MTVNQDRGSANSGILFGAVLVVGGTILLLERLDILPTNLLRHFWPMLWLIVGGLLFVQGRQLAGGVLIFIGAVLELQKLGLIRMRFWDLWPLAMIAIGALLLWRAFFPPKVIAGEITTDEARISEYTVFGGADIKAQSQAFEGGTATAIFGGVELDLRNAKILNSPAIIHADAICGGIEIKVPENWRVTAQSQAIFGGIDTKKALPPRADDLTAQHLIIKGMVVFGGVEVRN